MVLPVKVLTKICILISFLSSEELRVGSEEIFFCVGVVAEKVVGSNEKFRESFLLVP